MDMNVQARREITLEVARLFHLSDYIKAQKSGSSKASERAKKPWTELHKDDLEFYVKKVQPVMDAILTAGFVILRQSEVSQAYLPLRKQQIARPVIRLPTGSRGGSYADEAQQERERRR